MRIPAGRESVPGRLCPARLAVWRQSARRSRSTATPVLLLPAVATCVVILRRRRQWLGRPAPLLGSFLVGMALWILGHIGWIAQPDRDRPKSWVQWHTMFSLCGGIGPLVALWRGRIAGAREDVSAARRPSISSRYGMLGALRLRLLRARAERRACRPGQQLAGDAAVARAGAAAAADGRPRRRRLWLGARTSVAPTYQRLAIGVGGRILPSRSRPAWRSRANDYHLGTRATTSPGSCRSSATCGRRSTRPASSPLGRSPARSLGRADAGAAVGRAGAGRSARSATDCCGCSRSAIPATRSACC